MGIRITRSILGLIGIGILLVACGSGEPVNISATGEVVRTDYDLSGFKELAIADFFDAEIKQGAEFSVVVECEEALLPYLRIDVRGDRLRVGLEPGKDYNFEEATQRIEVTLPELVFVLAENRSSVQLISFDVEETLEFEVLDFSTISGEIDAKDLHILVSNHSTLKLDGSAGDINGEVTEMSTANLTGLNSGTINVEVDDKSSLRR